MTGSASIYLAILRPLNTPSPSLSTAKALRRAASPIRRSSRIDSLSQDLPNRQHSISRYPTRSFQSQGLNRSNSRFPPASSCPNPFERPTPSAPRSNKNRLPSPRTFSSHKTTSSPRPPPLQARLLSWGVLLIIGAAGTAFLYTARPGSPQRNPESKRELPRDSESKGIAFEMTAENLPGRPDTLTPEQEEKLKEFWTAVLQVFGVLDQRAADGTSAPELARAETGLSKKPKKKRISLFKRHRDDDSASTVSTDSASHASNGPTDTDDKYGQTKEFHEALANMSPETLRVTFWSMVKHDQPDALLLRFLRARKWDVEKALVMMVSTMRWRALDMHVDDDIIKNGEMKAVEEASGADPVKKKLGADFLTQMRLGKSFLHGTDREGRPMCFVRVKLHRAGEQSEESLERYTVFVIESARMVLAPPVDTACIVFDMTGFSMANMDYAPVKFMIKCFEANYPESLGVVLVHKAPWVFQGIWKIIRSWLDPVVASKVHFTNDVTELSTYIPPTHILKDLGGTEDWNYKYIEPVPGENDAMKDVGERERLEGEREAIVREFEGETVSWVKGEEGKETVKGKREEIARRLRDNYWVLDPYIRARSCYDRIGLINPGGEIRFYDEKKEEVVKPAETEAVVVNGAKVETSADDVD